MSNDNEIIQRAVDSGYELGRPSVIVVRNKYCRGDAWDKVLELTAHRVEMVQRRSWAVTLGTLKRPWIRVRTLEDDPDSVRGCQAVIWIAPSCSWAAGIAENERLERWQAVAMAEKQ